MKTETSPSRHEPLKYGPEKLRAPPSARIGLHQCSKWRMVRDRLRRVYYLSLRLCLGVDKFNSRGSTVSD